MEIWFFIIVSFCITLALKPFLSFLFLSFSSKKKLPPGPLAIPVIGNSLLLNRSFTKLESIVHELKGKYGPIITLKIGSRPVIFIGSHSLAHQALIQKGGIFSDRPKALETSKILNSNQHNISSAAYGPLWRLLRRNLISEILHPSRIKSYSAARAWVLQILIDRLLESSLGGSAVKVADHFQYAMFSLLVLMCFGEKLDDEKIKQIETVQRQMLLSLSRFNVLNFWPMISKFLFRNRWRELLQVRRNQESVLVPLIRSRIRYFKQKQIGSDEDEDTVVAYVDTLVDLDLPEGRKLDEGEMVSLCSEFLNGGTDTTSTALQWIMANLVKYPNIQARLYDEISGVMGPSLQSEIILKEDDLQNMAYLKAVVLEGLRRHPPGHFVLPHTVTKDVQLDGYTVPTNASVNFMVSEMGRDPNVWEEPMEFKPERFLIRTTTDGSEQTTVPVFDITGSKEIKMMPFGAGRRICPAFGLAMLHLEYFLANLIWQFEWKAADDHIDLSEKQEFTVVMKNPLQVHIYPRRPSLTTPISAPSRGQ